MPFPNTENPQIEGTHNHKWTDGERAAIRKETNRILADRTFKNSKRCQALFRSLIDRALADDHFAVKERILGVEVFGRDPDYDTSADPIVRIAANEIRKRLGQWYQEPNQRHEVKIHLMSGAYLLSFEFLQQDFGIDSKEPSIGRESVSGAWLQELDNQTKRPQSVPVKATSRTKWIWAGSLALFIILCFTAYSFVRHFRNSEAYGSVIWEPLLSSGQPVIICVPDAYPVASDGTNGQTIADWQSVADMIAKREIPIGSVQTGSTPNTPLADAEVAQRVATWLAIHGGKSSPRGSSSVTLSELRQEPTVLIGGFNPWTLILLSNLRYSMRVDPAKRDKWIRDDQNPTKRDWILEGGNPANVADYAIITRVFDSETGRWILALGGLRKYGTEAALEWLIDSPYISQLPADLDAKGNFQIVLKTNLINGSAGPPQIIAFHAF